MFKHLQADDQVDGLRWQGNRFAAGRKEAELAAMAFQPAPRQIGPRHTGLQRVKIRAVQQQLFRHGTQARPQVQHRAAFYGETC